MPEKVYIMRRKDREITDPARLREIMDTCSCCRLGLWDGEEVYIVPMNFGWSWEGEKLRLYFHSAAVGRKIELLRARPKVSFEMDTGHSLISGAQACSYSFAYQCLMGTGYGEILEDPGEKRYAMDRIMDHYTGRSDWEYRPACLEEAALICVTVERMSAKENPAR